MMYATMSRIVNDARIDKAKDVCVTTRNSIGIEKEGRNANDVVMYMYMLFT